MRSNPPISRNRAPGKRRRATRLKIAILGTATLSFAALGLSMAGPALADPTTSYVATGSDTTQDVMDALSNVSFGNAIIGSWDAINPVSAVAAQIITPGKISSTGTQTPCSFTRPNGSGQGLTALRESINPATTATPVLGVQQGCVDIGRSSSGPPSANLDPNGVLVWVPFALDAVGVATGGTTNISTADMFTFADLQTLYDNCGNVTEGGVTYNPNTAGAGQQQIDLYIPQSGSGTRNFWATQIGFSNTAPPACVHDTIQAGPNSGASVEEHNGLAYQSDPNGYGPFSIAQWISQRNGHNDRRHGAVLHNLDGISPFSNGNPTTGTLNTSWDAQLKREVFNIVAFDRIVNTGDGNFDPTLAGLLAGTTSRVCGQAFTIRNYGFATLSASTPHLCGATSSDLRAFTAGTI